MSAVFTSAGRISCLAMLLLSVGGVALHGQGASLSASPRATVWIDALRGEPVSFEEMLDDLRHARVVYLGEYHSISRHHQLEKQVLEGLISYGGDLVLAMEQFESFNQPTLDRFNRHELDLTGLLESTELDKRWPGHTNYHALLTLAYERRIPVLALNARAELIRSIGHRGLTSLSALERSELPTDIHTSDPIYERLLNKILGVHMALDIHKLRPVFEAQVARDETMAARLAEFLTSVDGKKRQALVICGRGHCEFGLGTPARLTRRVPEASQRILLLSESGDLQLSPEERKQAREVEISHEFLRELGRPAADYFHVIEPAPSARSNESAPE